MLMFSDYPEAINNGLVLGWIGLNSAFHHIQWGDHCVSDTTGQKSSKTTQCIVFRTTIFTAVGFCKKIKQLFKLLLSNIVGDAVTTTSSMKIEIQFYKAY